MSRDCQSSLYYLYSPYSDSVSNKCLVSSAADLIESFSECVPRATGESGLSPNPIEREGYFRPLRALSPQISLGNLRLFHGDLQQPATRGRKNMQDEGWRRRRRKGILCLDCGATSAEYAMQMTLIKHIILAGLYPYIRNYTWLYLVSV